MDTPKKHYLLINRLRRRDYMLWQIALCLAYLVLIALHFASFGILGHLLYKYGLVYLFIIFEIYLTARRLQDCNLPGWLGLLLIYQPFLVPGLLFLSIYPGTKGINKYGAAPCERNTAITKTDEY